MEDISSDSCLPESGNVNAENCQWQHDLVEKLQSVKFTPQENAFGCNSSHFSLQSDVLSPQAASQLLWATGAYSGPIPNGFYSIIPNKNLKEMFNTIPSLDELCFMGTLGARAEAILVDAEKDKKLFMLKQWSVALVKGHRSNPASVIKKLAGLVSDFYKRSLDCSANASMEETSQFLDNKGSMLLGQKRNASCRPRAILFKVLADAVGLESKLMTGIPTDGTFECTDSYKHLSVIIVLNSVELLVDLMRFPGQLIPFSAKAFLISHISAAGESDSAENDSCDSPLEPNSPLYGLADKFDGDKWGIACYSPLSSSHSEPNIANAVWRRGSRRKAVAEQCAASSSPEHPLFRARGRSMLSGDRQLFSECNDGVSTSRSVGASSNEARRLRSRSISITPEIGDDIVRTVRAMNETLKHDRLLRDSGEDLHLYSLTDKKKTSLDVSFAHSNLLNQMIPSSNQKSVSLPSSPHEIRGKVSERNETSQIETRDLYSMWSRVLESLPFAKQPLLPFEEWNIDFSELTVGARVGIGFFGEVFRGIWNGTDVAIKVLLEQDLTTENMENFCNEVSILSRLRHPNVILFLGACMKPPRLSMVTEYMEMGSLYYLIHSSGQKKKLSWRRRLKILQDICRGLICIHRMRIIHRDLKSANCLVDRHWTVKICDFGLSRMMTYSPVRDDSSAGTPEWMAPELIRNESFTEKCDIFSFGVIMWELCTLSRPWEGVPPAQVVYSVANEGTRLDIPEGPLGRLIADCWAEPDERPNCLDILSRLLDCEYTLC